MAVKLNDFIKVYPKVIDSNICEFLVDVFEQNIDKHERVENCRKPNFTQFNLTDNCKLSDKIYSIHQYLISIAFKYKKIYCNSIKNEFIPTEHNFEQFRIKKYFLEKEDQFDTHVDVIDYSSSRRFLSFMWYLNDVPKGGETVFNDLTIRPKAGDMLVFPPLWIFPHKGNIPKSNSKYIMSTYLHYK